MKPDKEDHLKIDLSDKGLIDIPDDIFSHNRVKYIDLSGNLIDKIDNKISLLTYLRWLDLNQNNFTQFPEEVFNLEYLQVLDLSNNSIGEIPKNITELHHLKTLNLKGNRIEVIPKEIIYLPNLTNINFSDNPIKTPPIEIVHRGIKAIRDFYLEFEKEESDYLYELKLLLVGEGRVGKTSIANSLSITNYKLKDEVTTEGIEIKPWFIPKKELGINKDFKINIWDFGGQEIYHSTHQFFLTKRSIYLLITETRKEDKHEDFYYWLNTIEILGDKSPVIIVLNKCDLPTKEIPIEEYKDLFKNIVSLEKVSCKPEYRDKIASLKEEIKRLITNEKLLPHVGTPLPKAWVQIRNEIEKIAKQGRVSIELDEYLEICRQHNRNEKSALFLSRFFHDLGVFLHFQDDLELRDIIFLDFEWVTDSVYKILDNKDVKNNFGLFTNADLKRIWRDSKYRNKRRELLQLMKNDKFEICFQIDKYKYLAPQLLRVDKIEYEWNRGIKSVIFEYRFKFMPKGILSRFIVKRNKDIHNNICWRYGVNLHYKDAKAIIIEKYFERKIEVKVQGRNSKEMITIIKKSFQEIFDDYTNLEIEKLIPCGCPSCQGSESPHYYKISDLQLRNKIGKETIECYKSFKDVKVKKILEHTGFLENEGGSPKMKYDERFGEVIIQKVEKFVEQNRLDNATDLMFKAAKKSKINSKLKEVILLQRRLKDVKNDFNKGIISRNDYQLELNKIATSIIDLVHS